MATEKIREKRKEKDMQRTLMMKSVIILSLFLMILGAGGAGLGGEKEGAFVEKELYAVDAMSTATLKVWLTGKGDMPKELLWKHISEVLGGKGGKKTYVLATSMDNIPLSTTIEFAVDPDKKVLYGFAEKGTEKLIHIKNNPKVSLNWHEEFMNDFSKSLCVQIRGTAELFEGDSPEMNEAISVYPYQYMIWNFIQPRNAATTLLVEPLQKAMAHVISSKMMMVKITMEQVVITDRSLTAKGYRSRQLWRRR
jgi:nitroimidazol reductase NimA-like FMN-containing flavoprotein (pyridoxamine 5'-phosphate oxidase superfamily)